MHACVQHPLQGRPCTFEPRNSIRNVSVFHLHPAWTYVPVYMQVLEELSTDLAMQVVSTAPGTTASKLQQLPQSLRSLAALAECPGLPAVCTLPQQQTQIAPRSGTRPQDLPEITLCVDSTPEHARTPAPEENTRSCEITDMLPSPGTSNGAETLDSSIWVQNHSVGRYNRSLFFLQKRARTFACPLLAVSRQLTDIRIVLPPTGCLVFGAGSVQLHRATFEGVAFLSTLGCLLM